MANEKQSREDVRPGDKVPGHRSMNLLKWAGVITPTLAAAYVFVGATTGDWDITDGIQNFNAEPDIEPETPEVKEDAEPEAPEVKDATETPAKNEEEHPSWDYENVEDEAATKATAAAACAADEVAEKVCVGPKEALTATADSKCDGIISLTREALLQDTSFVTPELVSGVEDPYVKAVYQAILDGDRSALTAALSNLYEQNGYFDPENASGTLDGLKDSIIIFPEDQIVINEDGWFLKRESGDVVKIVNCDGQLRDVKEELMSDTGKCGDTKPVIEKGPVVKTIPVEELPVENIKEPEICVDAYTDQAPELGGDPYRNGSLDRIVVYEDVNGNGTLERGDDKVAVDIRGQKAVAAYLDAHPEIAKRLGTNAVELNGEEFVKIRGEYYRRSIVEPIVRRYGPGSVPID